MSLLTCRKHILDKDSPCTKCEERIWEKKGSKEIYGFGVKNKRQIIVAISFVANGSSLLLQVIFI